jgi:hypothetical protein
MIVLFIISVIRLVLITLRIISILINRTAFVIIVRCINGDGNMRIPNPYEGRTHAEWIGIFYNELRRRNQMPNSVVES